MLNSRDTYIVLAIFAYALLVLFLMAGLSQAFEATVSSTEITVAYTEPSTNVDGTPLLDLSHTTIYLDIIGDGDGAYALKDVPATGPAGGGEISQTISIPILGEGETAAILWATASDVAGNESSPSPQVRFEPAELDRLAPSPPQ